MDLPCPGLYEGHAWWTGRNATRDYDLGVAIAGAGGFTLTVNVERR
ncbi:hypothetical protein [Streptomyces sioyaensis]